MTKLPKISDPVVIRTEFQNPKAWGSDLRLLAAPLHQGRETLYAHVQILEDRDHHDFTKEELVAAVPEDYDHSFFFVVSTERRSQVVSFRSLSSTRTKLEVAVSGRLRRKFKVFKTIYPLPNMSIEEFAQAVDADGIFRGFLKA